MAEQTVTPTYWQPMDTAPMGHKLLLKTQYGVAIFGAISPSTKHQYLWWAPVPQHKPD